VTLDETLSEPGDVLRYCYDYGDSWDLSIVLESVLPMVGSAPIAVWIDGRRAAPPEDCGGLRTAADLAEVFEGPGAIWTRSTKHSTPAHRGGTERARMAAFRPVACQHRCPVCGCGTRP
jgi:Plasmid pRiA4b ORF-3-like protein